MRKQVESLDEIDQAALSYSPPQDREGYAAEQRKLLLQALGKLKGQERLLYQLWFVFEVDARKAAAVFKISVKNFYKRKETLVLKPTCLAQASQRR